jgi:DNA-binding MarR family transcriptional regulator
MDRSDRRKYSIKLTPAGQAKLDEIMPEYYERVRSLMGTIPNQQRELLFLQLMQLKEKRDVFN